MPADARRILRILVTSSALAVAPLTSLVVTPAVSHADDCAEGRTVATDQCGVRCPDGTMVDEDASKCRAQRTGTLEEQLRQLPSPSELPKFDASGIPPLARVDLPDVVLPGVNLGLVPDIPLVLAPQLPGIGVPQLPPPPKLPAPPKLSACGPELGFGFKPCI